ncbi:hypothetical protein ABK040_013317 [Willaertia magna]
MQEEWREKLIKEENHNDDGTPLIGLDGGFTYISIVERLPKILTHTIASNSEIKFPINVLEAFQQLNKELEQGNVITSFSNKVKKNDWKVWQDQFQVQKKTWLEIPWFFLENYFYHLLLEILNYFEREDDYKNENPFYQFDLFHIQKARALENCLQNEVFIQNYFCNDFTIDLNSQLNENERINFMKELFCKSLWGNQADLSLSVGLHQPHEHHHVTNHDNNNVNGDAKEKQILHTLQENILVNHLNEVIDYLEKLKMSQNLQQKIVISFILDNCGLELLNDLFLAHYLLQFNYCNEIIFYCKSYPVFVSDVMIKDFHFTINQLLQNEKTMTFGNICKNYLKQQIWKLKENEFFNSPLSYKEIPTNLENEFSKINFLILKGDANYRRCFNDCKLKLNLNFKNEISYFKMKEAICCLRTIKSYTFIGLDENEETMIESKIKALEEKDKDWRYSGKYGVLCFYNKNNNN